MIEEVTGYIDFSSVRGNWIVVFDNPIITQMCSVTKLIYYEQIEKSDIELMDLKPGDAVQCRIKTRHGASDRPLLKILKL
jgi:hypothetical protein